MPDPIEIRSSNEDAPPGLDEIVREGARRMLAVALEAEAADYIARHQARDQHGRAQVVRNGKARPRKVTLGSGTIEVRAPRIHDRREGRAPNAVPHPQTAPGPPLPASSGQPDHPAP
jgi:transposase-like protein